MVTEHAVLHVDPERAAEFEEAIGRGIRFPQRSAGFRRARLLKGIEQPGTYLLLIEWDSVEAHTEEFRRSSLFAEWRAAVGVHFVSDPEVAHFEERPLEPHRGT
ncbi:MAG: antibiotic biosynthesis monooxygenase family protein [Acidimicrobiales bacterium]